MKKEKTKTKKKNNKIKVIILTIILCLGCGFGTYYVTLALDKAKNKGEVKMIVTFSDTDTYTIPSIKKMDKEEAKKEWPYIFKVENNGNAKGLYQIKIEDILENSIQRENLSFELLLNDEEIQTGKLSDIKDNILFTHYIEGMSEQEYKLYIWVTDIVSEESKYEYKLSFNTIKEGGPGF